MGQPFYIQHYSLICTATRLRLDPPASNVTAEVPSLKIRAKEKIAKSKKYIYNLMSLQRM